MPGENFPWFLVPVSLWALGYAGFMGRRFYLERKRRQRIRETFWR